MNKFHKYFFRRIVWLLFMAGLSCPATLLHGEVSQPEITTVAADTEASENRDKPRPREIVSIGRNVEIKQDETVRDLVVIFGDAVVNGTILKDCVVIGGHVAANGKFQGDLVTVLGSVTVGPEAQIKKDVIVVGGGLEAAPTSSIGGDQQIISLMPYLPQWDWLRTWLKQGLLLGRPIVPMESWTWLVALGFLAIYALTAILFPGGVQASTAALEKHPVPAFFSGFGILILSGPLFLLALASVIGVPVLLCTLLVGILFGRAAVLQFLGQQVSRAVGLESQIRPIGSLLLGGFLLILLYTLPFLALLIWGGTLVFGLGGVVLALFQNLQSSGPNPPSGVPVLASETLDPAVTSTPQVALSSFARAGFWIRTAALLLDLLLIGFLSGITGLGAIFFVVYLVYMAAMLAWKGTTLGGIVCGLKWVREDGRSMDVTVSIVRALSSVLSALALGLGYFWAAWDPEKQTWHDRIAGTVVLRLPKGTPLV